jgi:hypothetical protein
MDNRSTPVELNQKRPNDKSQTHPNLFYYQTSGLNFLNCVGNDGLMITRTNVSVKRAEPAAAIFF